MKLYKVELRFSLSVETYYVAAQTFGDALGIGFETLVAEGDGDVPLPKAVSIDFLEDVDAIVGLLE